MWYLLLGRNQREVSMRLRPAVSEEEAFTWLQQEAVAQWGDPSPALAQSLRELAKAMAMISAVDLPEDVEPA